MENILVTRMQNILTTGMQECPHVTSSHHGDRTKGWLNSKRKCRERELFVDFFDIVLFQPYMYMY
jgi:hypothetical protein